MRKTTRRGTPIVMTRARATMIYMAGQGCGMHEINTGRWTKRNLATRDDSGGGRRNGGKAGDWERQ